MQKYKKMSKEINILKSAEDYINNHDVEKSVEELFIEFRKIVDLHIEFEKYLKENKLNQNLEKMQRSKRLLAKRKLFAEWYLVTTQNELDTKVVFIDLSEFTFASKRTIQKDLSSEATV